LGDLVLSSSSRNGAAQGISHALLLDAAVTHARQANGARIVEACPMLKRPSIPGPIGLFVGSVSVFEQAGFQDGHANGRSGRPLMRKVLA
jgi:hypothetical protein